MYSRARPIALLTDFGYEDAYVGVMKGVLLSRCPAAAVLDLCHGIPRHDVMAGALQLRSAVPYCPPETVFLAVVDPGVGSERRPLCVRAGSRLFVGPDNGLLWPAAASQGIPEAFHLDRPKYWLSEVSATFHGRDVFAPVAALLALGRAAEDFGSPVDDPQRLDLPAPYRSAGGIAGEVIYVDRFGNAVTNIRPEDLGGISSLVTFEVGGRSLGRIAAHYGAVGVGEPVVVLGSLGYFEVAVNRGSAADLLGLRPGSPVTARG